MLDSTRAYEDLTPTAVLDALDASGLRGDGRLLQLNSYENRVFQVFLEDGAAVVAKFYRPGRWSDEQILEEHAFALELAQAEVPVVPPMALHDADPSQVHVLGPGRSLVDWRDARSAHRWSVSPRRAGREPELEDEQTLRILGRFIGRLHEVGRRSGFATRRRMALVAEAQAARDFLVDGSFVPPTELPAWDAMVAQAIGCISAVSTAVNAVAGPRPWLRLHGDCHLGNVLWRDGTPHIVDLDDACTGPAVQDLWMLVSGDATTMQRQLDVLLEGYRQFSDFDRHELRLIEPLRTLRMLRHSAWIAERWDDPTFPIHFPFFDSAAYWNQQTTQLREQVEAMQADGL